jgi:hypothetical protein
MPFPIDNDQLKILSQYLTTATLPYYTWATDFINDLYNTGARPNELLQVNRWTTNPSDPNQWQMLPQKANALRYFDKNLLSDSFNTSVINQSRPYQNLTLRQLEYVIHRVNPVGAVATIDKLISAYMFRYNRVRTMVADGMTNAQIRTSFGWSDVALVETYNGRQLYTILPMPSIEQYYITDVKNKVLVDSNEDKIISA